MFWLVLLPFQLFFGLLFGLLALPFAILLLPFALLLWLPFMILKFAFRLLAALVILPIIAIVTMVGLLVGGVALFAALLVPAIPLIFLGVCIWAIWRLVARPARVFPA